MRLISWWLVSWGTEDPEKKQRESWGQRWRPPLPEVVWEGGHLLG